MASLFEKWYLLGEYRSSKTLASFLETDIMIPYPESALKSMTYLLEAYLP